MSQSNAHKKGRYIHAFQMYGVIPMLMLLDEYEKKEDYRECAIIRDAIQERVENMNKMVHIGDEFDVPRRLSEINMDDNDYKFMEEENFKRNVKNYVENIKQIVNGQVHSK